ncbi:SLBB domain-containing protein [Pseudemcibacter sp.]|uniref:SLBB domain-containing protein n=1 Tax=Pseudemcibacter sp. TaxID=2943293 RepID=UPI003F69A89F
MKKNIIKIISLSLMGVFVFTAHAFAQDFDPEILNQLRQRSGNTGQQSISVQSPLDQLRERQYIEQLNTQLEARKDEGFSRIEQDYNRRLGYLKDDKASLNQFGYDIFNRLPLQQQVLNGSVPSSYILGAGDELIVNLKGSDEESYTVKIDREGRLLVPSLSPVNASGLSFGELEDILKKQVSDSLIGTEVFLSVATLRQISVLVAGEVSNPSLISTTSLASPIEVILQVGGIKKTGSLRNITILRGDEKIKVDLYDIIGGEFANIVNLRDGDRILVPTLRATIAIDGNLVRPGIYELPDGEIRMSSADALKLAGGPIRQFGNSFTHMDYDQSGRLNYSKLDIEGTIDSGEIIIVNLLENSQIGRVTLSGHVNTSGVRSLAAFNNVRDLIGSVKNLTENSYLLFGVIERTDPMTQTRQLIAFSPQKVLYGEENISLIDEDKVFIYSRKDIEFLRSDIIRQAIFTSEYLEEEYLPDGDLNPLYCAPVKRLARIISDTQSDRFASAVRAVLFRRDSTREQQKNSQIMLDQEELNDLALQRSQMIASSQIVPKQMALTELNEEEDKGEDKEDNYDFCPAIYQDVNNLLSFTLEHIVSVDGAVRLPGVFPITQNTSVNLLFSVSGGTSNDANMGRIEITSYKEKATDGNLVMNWEYIDSSISDLSEIRVNPGGGVRVSSVYTNFEPGAVLLSGEFVQPGVYTIRKGEKLSSLIARAGGLTDQSYPYGAIFTRDRVKQIQQQEMRKTAQRLQSAMVSASVKKNVETGGAIALQNMVNRMAEQEFIGRVVIEADPVVLTLDPEKDIVLEPGDSLFMPKRPNFIVTVGDVLNPSALQFVPGKGVQSYLDEVGGFTRAADEDRVFVVYPDGVAKPITLSSWGGDKNLSIPPGSAIVVPTDLSPYDSLTLVSSIGDIFRNLAVSAASIAVLVRN